MSVKLRLQRKGRKKAPFYHIVAADSRSPRDGKFIEKVGTYNPMTKPATIELDRDAAYKWLTYGAQPTDTVRAILRYKGVLYMKHILEGVKKGALTQEQADAKIKEWIDGKEKKITGHVEKTQQEKEAFLKLVDGTPKAKPVVEEPTPVVEEVAEEAVETVENAVEEATDAVENADSTTTTEEA